MIALLSYLMYKYRIVNANPTPYFVFQKVEQLRRIYDDEVDDMELMVAIYSERLLHGAWVGPTLFCIMVENLVNWRKSDRFFFEHGDTHAALTLRNYFLCLFKDVFLQSA